MREKTERPEKRKLTRVKRKQIKSGIWLSPSCVDYVQPLDYAQLGGR